MGPKADSAGMDLVTRKLMTLADVLRGSGWERQLSYGNLVASSAVSVQRRINKVED